MKQNPLALFKIGDILFWLALFGAAWFYQAMIASATAADNLALVEIAGEVKYRIDLKLDRQYELDEFHPPVRIAVRGGALAIIANDCPQNLCLKMGAISRPGQMIVCVPKKILIYIPTHHGARESVKAITG